MGINHFKIINCVLSTRSYHSADCDTDYSLVGSKVRLQPKSIHYSKQSNQLSSLRQSTR